VRVPSRGLLACRNTPACIFHAVASPASRCSLPALLPGALARGRPCLPPSPRAQSSASSRSGARSPGAHRLSVCCPAAWGEPSGACQSWASPARGLNMLCKAGEKLFLKHPVVTVGDFTLYRCVLTKLPRQQENLKPTRVLFVIASEAEASPRGLLFEIFLWPAFDTASPGPAGREPGPDPGWRLPAVPGSAARPRGPVPASFADKEEASAGARRGRPACVKQFQLWPLMGLGEGRHWLVF